MGRFVLFLLLVVVVPMGAYVVSHDYSLRGFWGQVRALRGTRPEPPTESQPEAEPEAEPKPGPEAEPQPEPKPEPKPDPLDVANALFDAGKFAEAAQAFLGVDVHSRGLSLLGAAFVRAFPKDLPDQEYLVITTRTGDTFEGFATETGNGLRLTDPTGHGQTFPNSAVATKRRVLIEHAVRSLAERVRTEGLDADVAGARLFALVQLGCTIGRPDAVAPLLARMVRLDRKKPFFLSAVRWRVPNAHRGPLFRAFTGCEVSETIEREPIVAHAPTRLGNGNQEPKPRPVKGIKNAKVKKLIEEAEPLLTKGTKLFNAIVRKGGAKEENRTDIVRAAGLLKSALDKLEAAMLIEDNDYLYHRARPASRYLFQLNFWLQQIEH